MGKVIWREDRSVFVARYFDANGKQRQVIAARPSSESARAVNAAKQAALRRLDEIETKVEAEIVRSNDPIAQWAADPIEDHLGEYESFLEAGGWKGRTSPSYRKKVMSRVRRVLTLAECETLASTQVSNFDRAMLLLKDDPKIKTERTRRHYRDAVMDFGRWLARERTKGNPFENLVQVTAAGDPARRRRGWFPDEELRRLLHSAEHRGADKYLETHPGASRETLDALSRKGQERAAIYRFAAITAVRMDEIRTLTWGRVSIKDDRVTVRVRAEDGKADRDDSIIVLSDELATQLRARRRSQKAAGQDLVFQVSTKILRRLYADMLFAGISKVDERGRHRDFHSLRYTAARRLALAGAPIQYIQRLMRHTDIRLTMDLYADLDLDELLAGSPVRVPPLVTHLVTQHPQKGADPC